MRTRSPLRTSSAGSRVRAITTLPATPSRPAKAYLLSVGALIRHIGSSATITVTPENNAVRPAVAMVVAMAASTPAGDGPSRARSSRKRRTISSA